MTTVNFAGLGLSEPITRSLAAEGYETPTPIQARTIPLLLAGRDVLGVAQTGTGKTAAFGLPLIERIAAKGIRPAPKTCHTLILAPTRELAVQIAESLRVYGRNLRLTQALILGGVSRSSQIKTMQRGVDFLIATPGRLVDLMGEGHVRLDSTGYLVLDEADRMLDMGFIRDVTRIVSAMPRKRQSLLFSATMPDSVAALAEKMLNKPERVEITPQTVTVDRIAQSVELLPKAEKRARLTALLSSPDVTRAIVFARTKHGANKVAENLIRDGLKAEVIHGNKSQNARQAALKMFKTGRSPILVATDIAARGIDVDAISHVINYELPDEPESYVHRIGRTARAGASGIAITLCDPTETEKLRAVERCARRKLLTPEDAARLRDFAEPPEPKRGRGGPRPGRPQKSFRKPEGGQQPARPANNRRRRRPGRAA